MTRIEELRALIEGEGCEETCALYQTELLELETAEHAQKIYRAEFVPQAWVNDYAVECDAQGPRDWELGPMTKKQVEELSLDSYERDALRFHDNAPQWVKEWAGPFEIYIFAGGE